MNCAERVDFKTKLLDIIVQYRLQWNKLHYLVKSQLINIFQLLIHSNSSIIL